MCHFSRFWNVSNQTGKAVLSVVFIQTSMFVHRWRWCGDGRGGSGACRAWYQRVVHWYVWKDGHLPARGTDRSYNPSHFFNLFPQLGSVTIVCLSTDVIFVIVILPSVLFFLLWISVPKLTYSGTCEDYRLLENMNKLTSLKYMEMKDISINISRNLQDLNNKCE